MYGFIVFQFSIFALGDFIFVMFIKWNHATWIVSVTQGQALYCFITNISTVIDTFSLPTAHNILLSFPSIMYKLYNYNQCVIYLNYYFYEAISQLANTTIFKGCIVLNKATKKKTNLCILQIENLCQLILTDFLHKL